MTSIYLLILVLEIALLLHIPTTLFSWVIGTLRKRSAGTMGHPNNDVTSDGLDLKETIICFHWYMYLHYMVISLWLIISISLSYDAGTYLLTSRKLHVLKNIKIKLVFRQIAKKKYIPNKTCLSLTEKLNFGGIKYQNFIVLIHNGSAYI